MTVCVRGRSEFVEKTSADVSPKKFSDKKLSESQEEWPSLKNSSV